MKELNFDEETQENGFVRLTFIAFDMTQGEFYDWMYCEKFNPDVFPCLVPKVVEF